MEESYSFYIVRKNKRLELNELLKLYLVSRHKRPMSEGSQILYDVAKASGDQHKRDFMLGDAIVRPMLNRIEVRGEVTQVEPKVMKVLLTLVGRAGNVVTREELLDAVWPDPARDDYLLNRAISELRKIFGDNAENPAYIETIRKRGYRLIAPLRPSASLSDAASLQHPSEDEGITPIEGENVAGNARGDQLHFPSKWPAILVVGGVVSILCIAAASIFFGQRVEAVQYTVSPVTSFHGSETEPSLSTSGDRVAFVWSEGLGGENDVFVKTVNGNEALNLTNSIEEERFPIWRPDGEEIIFARKSG